MADETTTKAPRTPPGPGFFLGAMALYLFLVQGLSLWGAGTSGSLPPLGAHPELPGYTRTALEAFAAATGHSHAVHVLVALALLYACMVALFFLTRRFVKGPVWLGSLAGSAFMAHPVKTELFFETIGIYYLVSALLAILVIASYLRVIEQPSVPRYLTALALHALAVFPFTINAPLFGVIILLEFYPATPETRRWARLLPFLALTTAANGLHMDTLYAQFPSVDAMVAPLLLILYPIGLLPETAARFQENPWIGWGWGAFASVCAGLAFAKVKNGPFRLALIGVLAFRFFPGAEPIDFSTLDGGAQLLFPLALACVGLAGFSRWMMWQEAWGRPAVALTTMLCIVLFVLQFQANRARALIEAPVAADAAAQGLDVPEPDSGGGNAP